MHQGALLLFTARAAMWKSRLKNALATHANDWSIGTCDIPK